MSTRWLRGFRDARLTSGSGGSGGGGAPTDAEFIVLGLDSQLTAERVITGQAGVVSLTDNGPNSTLIIDVAPHGIDFGRLQTITTARLLGRSTAGSGDVEQISLGTGLSLVAGVLDATGLGFVPTSRQIIAGTGLSGGGNLTTDRTLAVLYGVTAGTATQGNDPRLPTTDQKAALAGTDGTPNAANRYVTDTDPRLAAAAHAGIATLNFGPGGAGQPDAQVVITGQADIDSMATILAGIRLQATADHSVDEIRAERIHCYAGDIVDGVGFTIFGELSIGTSYGDFLVNWSWF